MYLLGYDIGSSSVKASLVRAETGQCIASAFHPKTEAPILSREPGWAEQDPRMWWNDLKMATAEVLSEAGEEPVAAIGLSYQMHGLVCIDRELRPLRPAIIWCDSRAVPYGEKAFHALGEEWCLEHLLNPPGNFTAAKLAWVREQEPALYDRIWKILLPGDYIAARMTGEVSTTVSGLSEGIFWDFRENRPSERLLAHFGFDREILPPVRPTFSEQGRLLPSIAEELGLPSGIPVTYRAGDQPNNALSLGVFRPGQIASTAGTSGVVYGVNGSIASDPQGRVNTFAHVNHEASDPRLGVLLCINGAGLLNAWMRRNVAPEGLSYAEMNERAARIPVGSGGVSILPFGNGAERMLGNRSNGCSVHGLDLNRHSRDHLLRATQEGIVFSFQYGIEILESLGIRVDRIHAGLANMFLSPVFRDTLAGVSGAEIELFNTDGAAGAARAAGIGAGIYSGPEEAFSTLERLAVVHPENQEACRVAYERWKSHLTEYQR